MIRIPYETLKNEFQRVLEKKGFTPDEAIDAATVFAKNSLDGVYTHGINRFPKVIENIEKGMIDPSVRATCELSFGAMERWDGHRGFGPLAAKQAMDRACALAKQYGIGIVALGNNNHWMRGGSYGWQAADQGCIGICWANTLPNMPAWGAKDIRIGNNPLVLAVPMSTGQHVVVDCALSQYSYGKMEEYRLKGQQLPYPGGYDEEGNLTTDPGAIEKTLRVVPMGYWKGSGISILLDLIGTVLANGNATSKIGTFESEVGVTQIMIAIDPEKGNSVVDTDQMVMELIKDIKSSEPITADGSVMYPGERVIKTHAENLALGIPVIEEKWEEILNM